ncbi:hypothetical protein PHYBLDRAFT_168287 [Phycomyces blakesleeanus NRRL 1555(-)]|uniref:Uncharacterized protein n=1 Tax=Phycomyces blakesleeanus (strain ATCC 8743b / DSM 1359 / FGSC 10004 / NBRC 33097 / NRRL 1555) TaxID=763407 RepID=A0A163DWN0_PHYB8|nr:hypothetical protein PHYBLDRAFT_168287 [Phycomyces blakesleeanus NRRL 1555(-)]OAD73860.1 hypothetical protein PHYBLDRAFT_168287 [Phycomyces blakesleeanus NRRL 1555(-)]|eukprot:XP_018291900.1 hypothetical protein PHYBLDRAFT_168287 [Phycomyces blakesleeanus NRRL 1555(-)]
MHPTIVRACCSPRELAEQYPPFPIQDGPSIDLSPFFHALVPSQTWARLSTCTFCGLCSHHLVRACYPDSSLGSRCWRNFCNLEIKLETKQQVIVFLDEIYNLLPVSVVNPKIYEERMVTFSEVFGVVLVYSSYFDKKALRSFSSLCGKNSVELIDYARNMKGNIVNNFVDRFPGTAEVELYESIHLIENDDTVAKFNCRTNPIH